MHPKRKKRLTLLIIILVGVGSAAGLALYALGQNIDLYYTPSQFVAAGTPENQIIRMGGIVQKNSVHFADKNLQVNFVITDFKKQINVQYSGVLPALFREGQGIVVQGKFKSNGILVADQVLAKHDENYLPPGLKKIT
jgi:cytochrome c-type biogenesis protein CcmE